MESLKMNLMEQVKSFDKQIKLSHDDREIIWVHVTHIENPANFYVRPIAYSKYLTEFEHPDMASRPEIQVGATIIFKSEIVKKYVRGQIVYENFKDESSVFNILAIDNGFLEKNVPPKKIYNPKYHAPIPPLAKKCKLAQCEPLTKEWSKDAIDAMKDFVGTEPAKMIIRAEEQGILCVDLINSTEDIAKIMVLSEFAGLGYNTNQIINCFEAPRQEQVLYTYRQFHRDQTIHVRVLRGPKDHSLKGFYVAEVHEYKKYVVRHRDISNYLKSSKRLPVESMKVGTLVGGYDDDNRRYGRGLITKIIEPDMKSEFPQTKAEVLFVDSGATKVLHRIQMVVLSDSLCVNQPPLAIFCSAEESQAWDNGLPKFLYEGYEFDIVIQEIGYKFEKPNIVCLKKRDRNAPVRREIRY